MWRKSRWAGDAVVWQDGVGKNYIHIQQGPRDFHKSRELGCLRLSRIPAGWFGKGLNESTTFSGNPSCCGSRSRSGLIASSSASNALLSDQAHRQLCL